jgi:CheY-like chemotaxis protein
MKISPLTISSAAELLTIKPLKLNGIIPSDENVLSGHYPLILLDAHMPEMDGFTVAERIKENPALAGVTILMLSSADLPEYSMGSLELGGKLVLGQAHRPI